jgi:hypothetical protein
MDLEYVALVKDALLHFNGEKVDYNVVVGHCHVPVSQSLGAETGQRRVRVDNEML